jgi:hypothetical protein
MESINFLNADIKVFEVEKSLEFYNKFLELEDCFIYGLRFLLKLCLLVLFALILFELYWDDFPEF